MLQLQCKFVWFSRGSPGYMSLEHCKSVTFKEIPKKQMIQGGASVLLPNLRRYEDMKQKILLFYLEIKSKILNDFCWLECRVFYGDFNLMLLEDVSPFKVA